MAYSSKFYGCKVFIHADREQKLSINSTIVEYNQIKMTVIVYGNLPELKENEKVSLLLLLKKSVIEYQGIVRKVNNSGNREITLFKGREKEEREDARYELNVHGVVDGLIMGERVMMLGLAMDALVVNISKGGILIRTQVGTLNKGTSFRLKMVINGIETVLEAKVMRTRYMEEKEVEYGCILTGKI